MQNTVMRRGSVRHGSCSNSHCYSSRPCFVMRCQTKHVRSSGRVQSSSGSVAPPSLQSLADAASGAVTRLQRLAQPPPPGFPPGPAGDQSVAMLAGPLEFITRLRREHGQLVGMLLGGERVVLVSEPAAARQILIEQPDVFVKSGTAFFPGSSLTGNGLLVSDGDEWRRQRRMANPAFRKAAVDKYAEEMIAATLDLLDGPFAAAADASSEYSSRQQGSSNGSRSSSSSSTGTRLAPGVRDVYADFNQLTLNITLAALFGLKGGSAAGGSHGITTSGDTAAQVVAAVEKAFTYFAARGATAMVVPEWVPTPDNVAFRDAVQQLDDLIYSIIDARQAEASSSNDGRNRSDLLQALLDSTDEQGRPMARTALRDELMTLLVAGQETSAILLGWAAALLAHNPKVQVAVAAEVLSVLPAAAHTTGSTAAAAAAVPSAADVGRLPLLTGVILEALRLYSPAYMVGRCACTDVVLAGGYSLPAGTTVLVSPYLLHREPSRWRQPSLFNPERWLPFLTGQQGDCPAPPATAGSSNGCPVSHVHGEHVVSQNSSSSSRGNGSCPVLEQTGTGQTSNVSSTNAGSGAYSFMSVLRDLGPNGAYLPFGGGLRNCIGTGFAMTEAVLVLAMLLRRFELQPITPAAGFPRPKPMLTLRPEAVQLRMTHRLERQP